MAKHHPDLIMCRKQPGIAIGRLCEKCDGKCVICDSYVRPCTLVRVCDECNYGSFQGRCVICGGVGISDAYYCKECTQQEKDRDGCPKIVNLGSAKTDLFYERKKYGFKKRWWEKLLLSGSLGLLMSCVRRYRDLDVVATVFFSHYVNGEEWRLEMWTEVCLFCSLICIWFWPTDVKLVTCSWACLICLTRCYLSSGNKLISEWEYGIRMYHVYMSRNCNEKAVWQSRMTHYPKAQLKVCNKLG